MNNDIKLEEGQLLSIAKQMQVDKANQQSIEGLAKICLTQS